MKVLHIDTGREWRGGQRQALFLHEGLLKSGIHSALVCNADGELCKKNVSGLIPLPFKGEADTGFITELRKVIRKLKPDIVHTHDAHSLTPALVTGLTDRSFRLINTRRVDFSINKGFFSRKKYDNSRVDRVVAISKAIARMLADDGVKPSKIPVIYSGVRFPESINYSKVLELREKYGLTPETYVAGCVANMADHKDHFTLLKGYDKFSKIVPDTKLILVGDGPLLDEVRHFAESLPCSDSVIFAGYSDYVYEHIGLFDVFCMSSKTEGLCTSIIDAFFMGRPVVATKAGGIPELVKHKFNGLLSEVGDAEEFAENLLEVYDDMPLEAKFSANAYHTALKFSDGTMVTNYIRLYSELISGR